MINTQSYEDQAQLLVQVLPFVAREDVFALKGGTALNLFLRPMPRLSVDIDLTYLPIADRERSFLLSVKRGEPDWSLLDIQGIENLPAVQWKLENVRKMSAKKHQSALARLESVLARM